VTMVKLSKEEASAMYRRDYERHKAEKAEARKNADNTYSGYITRKLHQARIINREWEARKNA